MLTNEQLNELMTTPSAALIEDMKKIEGDIMILGAGGKMGPTLCELAAKAVKAAGLEKKIYAVSRFSSEEACKYLQNCGVTVIKADLLDMEALKNLPDAENIIYMPGKKFGTDGNEWETWAMNSTLPAFVANKYKNSRIVVFSSANIYPIAPVNRGGCTEQDPVVPLGEYPMSCLARERAFEYVANRYGTKVFIYRLCFAVALNYGVLCDIGTNIMEGKPVQLGNACFNYIWQGSANEYALRSILLADSPVVKMNISGPEVVSVKYVAEKLGCALGIEPIFEGEPENDAYLVNTMECIKAFGYPSISAGELIDMQADWLKNGGKTLGKPTHFEARNGKY
ncbi:MAG: NAD(P)-dependent oxidoreductase [Clostridia bacterium]|nr:NAD(P)-dependent oxidoreductase [Clostridia bacterium]